ncbi:MAG: response regulator [Elusimicrobia bacterium]|nr:response regulator [Elusimicrobiota bacterium]
MSEPQNPAAAAPAQPPAPVVRVLVTDDDANIRALLQDVLESQGYQVDTACDGQEALDKINRQPPDLVLLDVEMPIMTGWEVVGKLKSDTLLQHLPVLLLTSLSRAEDKIQGLDLGADDYLTKPFNPGELLARVRSTLKRKRVVLEANPLSRLPGNISIEREINARIASGGRFAVLYADLNNFKAFNDRYGFKRGDEVIQKTAQILLSARIPGDFVGHVGGDDFIMVTTLEHSEPACRKIVTDFELMAPALYDPEDQARGYIEITDRQGQMARFPFVGVAVGAVTNEIRPLTSIGLISALGAEMKKFAKRSPRSAYAFDRRTY